MLVGCLRRPHSSAGRLTVPTTSSKVLTPMADFGAELREARERKGVSLRQIAAATKISVGALEALERNDISKLPGGIFSRAFVRSYATEIGLDPDETIRKFLAQFPAEAMAAPNTGVPADARARATRDAPLP